MTRKDDWIVHPNRSELGPNRPGRNGHYRRRVGERTYLPEETCRARVSLPAALRRVADADGTVTFSGHSWRFVLGAARTWSRGHVSEDVPLPFGYRDGDVWHWWDGTTSETSILEASDAHDYITEYLLLLFPGSSFELTDLR